MTPPTTSNEIQFSAEQRQHMLWCIYAVRHVDLNYDRDEFPELEENERLAGSLELGKTSGFTPAELARMATITAEALRTLDDFLDDEIDSDIFLNKGIEEIPNYESIYNIDQYVNGLATAADPNWASEENNGLDPLQDDAESDAPAHPALPTPQA